MNVGAIRRDGGFSFAYNDYAVHEVSIELLNSFYEGSRSLRRLKEMANLMDATGVHVWFYTQEKTWYVDFFTGDRGYVLIRILLHPSWIKSITVNETELVYQAQVYVDEPKTAHHLTVEYLEPIKNG